MKLTGWQVIAIVVAVLAVVFILGMAGLVLSGGPPAPPAR